MCTSDKKAWQKTTNFKHKLLNDQYITFSKVTGIWSLCYIETKGFVLSVGYVMCHSQQIIRKNGIPNL